MGVIQQLKSNEESNRVKFVIYSFDDAKVNYWGITKCANLSISKALEERFGEPSFPGPMQAKDSGYYNFSAVRDPVDRFISMYKMNLERPELCYLKKPLSVDELLEHVKETPDSERNVHFRSQSYFVAPQGTVIPELYRVDALNTLEQLFGFSIPHINKSSTEKTVELTENQLNTIGDTFSRDIDIWNNL